MTTVSLVAVGLVLLLIVVAGVVVLWTVDARRAEHVANDRERVEGRPARRRWRQRNAGPR